MKIALTCVVMAMGVLSTTTAKADPFLQNVAKYYDCKFKEELLPDGTPFANREIFRVPGQPSAMCIEDIQCVRNQTPTPQPWAATTELTIVASAPLNECPKTATLALTDASAASVTREMQTQPNVVYSR